MDKPSKRQIHRNNRACFLLKIRKARHALRKILKSPPPRRFYWLWAAHRHNVIKTRLKNFKRRQMRDLEAVNQALNDYEKTIDKDWQPNQ